MNKIRKFIISFIVLSLVSSCAGYEPIFGSKNVQFTILDYSIEGDKILGNKLYVKLRGLSNTNENNYEARSLEFLINISKEKIAISKDSAGKILQYKINLNTKVEVKDVVLNNIILNQTFNNSLTYKSQTQYSDTLKLEKKSIETLINNTYQELIVKLSQLLASK